MARFAIGDIQGCYTQFMELLSKIGFSPSRDVLYLVGDLVNRGPDSLKVLKWLYKNQDSVVTVLGNHDFYLMGRFGHVLKAEPKETIVDVLNYRYAGKLIDWLRSQSLIYHDADYIIAHAGIYPKMNFNEVLQISNAISNCLRRDDYPTFIEKLYGNKPNFWSAEHNPLQKMKFVVNSCTRMRYLNMEDYSLDYKYKGELKDSPTGLAPWFQAKFDPSINKPILFGHWASLGLVITPNYISLDTGCVWGKKLTAINLEDKSIFQV